MSRLWSLYSDETLNGAGFGLVGMQAGPVAAVPRVAVPRQSDVGRTRDAFDVIEKRPRRRVVCHAGERVVSENLTQEHPMFGENPCARVAMGAKRATRLERPFDGCLHLTNTKDTGSPGQMAVP